MCFVDDYNYDNDSSENTLVFLADVSKYVCLLFDMIMFYDIYRAHFGFWRWWWRHNKYLSHWRYVVDARVVDGDDGGLVLRNEKLERNHWVKYNTS